MLLVEATLTNQIGRPVVMENVQLNADPRCFAVEDLNTVALPASSQSVVSLPPLTLPAVTSSPQQQQQQQSGSDPLSQLQSVNLASVTLNASPSAESKAQSQQPAFKLTKSTPFA